MPPSFKEQIYQLIRYFSCDSFRTFLTRMELADENDIIELHELLCNLLEDDEEFDPT